MPRPIQIAHQSSFFQSSVQREESGWATTVASLWLMIFAHYVCNMGNWHNYNIFFVVAAPAAGIE
jgi:hypothetical protein